MQHATEITKGAYSSREIWAPGVSAVLRSTEARKKKAGLYYLPLKWTISFLGREVFGAILAMSFSSSSSSSSPLASSPRLVASYSLRVLSVGCGLRIAWSLCLYRDSTAWPGGQAACVRWGSWGRCMHMMSSISNGDSAFTRDPRQDITYGGTTADNDQVDNPNFEN